MAYVYIGLGSNLGDRLVNLAGALVQIETLPETVVLGVSHIYESESWPDPDQPRFANAVAALDTPLPLDELLDAFKDIEAELGRKPGDRNAPRTIDVDILLAEDEEWESERITVPHPRMAERDFVITPLLELSPNVEWPDGTPVTRKAVRVGHVTGNLGAIPGFEDRTRAEEPPGVPLSTADMRAGSVHTRPPLPGEEWAAAFEFGSDPAPIGMLAGSPVGRLSLQGRNPTPQASFVQLILEQAGIPYVWYPFAPEATSDPYGFGRRFRLMVPASMAEEAKRLLSDAQRAPIDWREAEPGEG